METILVISKSFEESKETIRGYIDMYKKDYPKDLVRVFLKKRDKITKYGLLGLDLNPLSADYVLDDKITSVEVKLKNIHDDVFGGEDHLFIIKWLKFDDYLRRNMSGYGIIFAPTAVRVDIAMDCCYKDVIDNLTKSIFSERIVVSVAKGFNHCVRLDLFLAVSKFFRGMYADVDMKEKTLAYSLADTAVVIDTYKECINDDSTDTDE